LCEVKNKKENLNNYTDEEDFILGIMLGYDRYKQCDRFIKRRNEKLRINRELSA